MATFVDFSPSSQVAFSFQATIGPAVYQVTALWNIARQGFYVQVADLSGNIIVTRALVGGGPTQQAVFTWDDDAAIATLPLPHNVPLGQLCKIYASQTGTSYDGLWLALSTGPNTLNFDLLVNPSSGPLTGQVDMQPINLVQGYIAGGWLLYHEDTQQFEFASAA